MERGRSGCSLWVPCVWTLLRYANSGHMLSMVLFGLVEIPAEDVEVRRLLRVRV